MSSASAHSSKRTRSLSSTINHNVLISKCTYIGLHVKRHFLSHMNQNPKASTNLSENTKRKISWKPVHWRSAVPWQTGGRRKVMNRLIATSRNRFANAPQNRRLIHSLLQSSRCPPSNERDKRRVTTAMDLPYPANYNPNWQDKHFFSERLHFSFLVKSQNSLCVGKLWWAGIAQSV